MSGDTRAAREEQGSYACHDSQGTRFCLRVRSHVCATPHPVPYGVHAASGETLRCVSIRRPGWRYRRKALMPETTDDFRLQTSGVGRVWVRVSEPRKGPFGCKM